MRLTILALAIATTATAQTYYPPKGEWGKKTRNNST